MHENEVIQDILTQRPMNWRYVPCSSQHCQYNN